MDVARQAAEVSPHLCHLTKNSSVEQGPNEIWRGWALVPQVDLRRSAIGPKKAPANSSKDLVGSPQIRQVKSEIGLQPLKNTRRLGNRPISMVGKETRFETSPATSIFVILLTFGPYLLRVISW